MSRMTRKLNSFLQFFLHKFLNWKLVSHHTVSRSDPLIQDNEKDVGCNVSDFHIKSTAKNVGLRDFYVLMTCGALMILTSSKLA